ncbi:MAG: [protein-PII] uridylyltransferase [Pseudomonadota bacterium]
MTTPTRAKKIARPLSRQQSLKKALQQLADLPLGGSDEVYRQRVAELLSADLAAQRKQITDLFDQNPGMGLVCSARHTGAIDRMIGALLDHSWQRMGKNHPHVRKPLVFATGGYGRRELCLHSDIDLLFIISAPEQETFIQMVLYILWDLDLQIGHAVRSKDELTTAARDDTVRTALLERRLLWGARAQKKDIDHRCEQIFATAPANFIQTKLTEREKRHTHWGNSRYLLEPNIKESKGGLRDLHSLRWISASLEHLPAQKRTITSPLSKKEQRRFEKANNFLMTIRWHLHVMAGRDDNHLLFDVQKQIAQAMGYTRRADHSEAVERFMRHYFLVARDVGALTRVFCAAVHIHALGHGRSTWHGRIGFRAQEIDGFPILDNRLCLPKGKIDPILDLTLFHTSQRSGMDVHPLTMREIAQRTSMIYRRERRVRAANDIFMDILLCPYDKGRNPEGVLRQMRDGGILSRFLPCFGRIEGQMQFDMYHRYTTDEHSLIAVGNLARMESGKDPDSGVAGTIIKDIGHREALYLAMLAHDLGKGAGGDHSVIGEEIVGNMAKRFALSQEAREIAMWLVRHHLAMSATALRRDLEDEKTIEDFSQLVASAERLRLLLILTTADIKAVGAGRWTSQTKVLLGQLYQYTLDKLSGGFRTGGTERKVTRAKQAVREQLADLPAEEIDAFLALGSSPYWLSLDCAVHVRHARMMTGKHEQPMQIEIRNITELDMTEVTVRANDEPGLLERLAAALAFEGMTISQAKIFSLSDGTILFIFYVQQYTTRHMVCDDWKEKDIAVRLKAALEKQTINEVLCALPAPRSEVFETQTRVHIDNQASRTHTVIEVQSFDRPGLLADIAKVMAQEKVRIWSARITTYGQRVIDVFYVKDIFGLKIESKIKMDNLRKKIHLSAQGEQVKLAGITEQQDA